MYSNHTHLVLILNRIELPSTLQIIDNDLLDNRDYLVKMLLLNHVPINGEYNQIGPLWNDTFEQVMMAVVLAYFGGRTTEKASSIIKGK